MEYWTESDSYTYPNSSVLINKLNIKDKSLLEQKEVQFFQNNLDSALFELAKIPLEKLTTLDTLQRIHRILFSDLYEWAGDIRTVRLQKGHTVFCYPEYIVGECKVGFDLLHCPDHMFLKQFAKSFGYINIVHPFREGNGRTQKWVFDEILKDKGYIIHWDRIDPDTLLNACISDYNGDNGAGLYPCLMAGIEKI